MGPSGTLFTRKALLFWKNTTKIVSQAVLRDASKHSYAGKEPNEIGGHLDELAVLALFGRRRRALAVAEGNCTVTNTHKQHGSFDRKVALEMRLSSRSPIFRVLICNRTEPSSVLGFILNDQRQFYSYMQCCDYQIVISM